ncbi:MAG: UDP-N-acetylglucosamine 2-epimerase (non-hydrolyzing), partial [Candidatus Krumholzibacteria bacterium]|nr:UDP-N-acetylglucosamine 2-epimerase (non-hydrolyzing) [Candidatus Krumholzibacteria bacterium]
MTYKVVAVVGARPNYMKVAPIWRELGRLDHISKQLVHTGQHYDQNMSKVFFDELKLPKPDVYLGVGSGSHGVQTAKVMVEIEKVLTAEKPQILIVVGDVNSTMASALVAAKIGIPIAHVEAGLRSFDRTMPEEINRMVTDILSDLLFTTEASARENLVREGISQEKIHFVGNVMIDSLTYYRPMAERSKILSKLSLEPGGYGLVTLHRPANVDDPQTMTGILTALAELGHECPLVFPAHPRTGRVLRNSKARIRSEHLNIIDPVGYLDFVKLMMHARIVLTDSGGIQEETTVLGVPCLTIRENTERPITTELGTNRIVGMSPQRILDEGRRALRRGTKSVRVPELWDGNASERIVKVID